MKHEVAFLLILICTISSGIGAIDSAFATPHPQQTTEVQTKEVHVKVATVHHRRPRRHRKKLVIVAPEVKIQNAN